MNPYAACNCSRSKPPKDSRAQILTGGPGLAGSHVKQLSRARLDAIDEDKD